MTSEADAARGVAAAVADELATPDQARRWAGSSWWPQSLAHGAPGVAMLHIELARTGDGPWERAHKWLECATARGVESSQAHLHYGAPALALALHTAESARGRGYERACAQVDEAVAALVRRRLADAHARIDRAERPVLAEFDAIRGLSGLGAYMLVGAPHRDELRGILAYLVRLTEPLSSYSHELPGWWADVGPGGTRDPEFTGGHANTGMAHGICGPLALLSLAALAGHRVRGQDEAIGRILAWLDRWRRRSGTGPWWPAWITRPQAEGVAPLPPSPSRPSWCYGTAGTARAQQLAAQAIGDPARRAAAEDGLHRALQDPAQLSHITDASLCHGHAGLAHIARVAGLDCPDHLPPLALATTEPRHQAQTLLGSAGIGLLEGAAGTALALHTAHTGTAGAWDAFLLAS